VILGQTFTDQQKKPIIKRVRRNIMYDYWVVIDKTTGKVIAHCGEESDAFMLTSFAPDKRTYRKQKFIMDQVITVTSTTDKQLPGQQGLPAAKEELPPIELQQQVWLPEGQGIPVNAK
jgi:hypothetical protein